MFLNYMHCTVHLRLIVSVRAGAGDGNVSGIDRG